MSKYIIMSWYSGLTAGCGGASDGISWREAAIADAEIAEGD